MEAEGNYRPDLVGLPRLIEYLKDGVDRSEKNAVKYGTNYVEGEEAVTEAIKTLARNFGGDLTSPQWYAGASAVLSYFASYAAEAPLVGPIMDMVIGPASLSIARIHDSIVKEGVQVFDGE